MEERTKKAFDFAQESTKQIITLSTGIIALTITFAKDFVGSVPAQTRDLALYSWCLFLLSVLCGLWTLLALTGTLEPVKARAESEAPAAEPSIRGKNVTIPSILQIITFFLALTLAVIFAACAVRAL